MTWVHLSGVPPWTTLVRKRIKGPYVIRPRKEAPKERFRDIRSAGPDVNLVGNGPETQSPYLRTGRAADLGHVHTHHQKP